MAETQNSTTRQLDLDSPLRSEAEIRDASVEYDARRLEYRQVVVGRDEDRIRAAVLCEALDTLEAARSSEERVLDVPAAVRPIAAAATVIARLERERVKIERRAARAIRAAELAEERRVKALVLEVYAARRDRAVHPEGSFDDAKRWYPSAREDANGDGSRTRSPSRAWPYSYMLRCRTREHCRVLVERALAGNDVPDDVRAVVPAPAEKRSA